MNKTFSIIIIWATVIFSFYPMDKNAGWCFIPLQEKPDESLYFYSGYNFHSGKNGRVLQIQQGFYNYPFKELKIIYIGKEIINYSKKYNRFPQKLYLYKKFNENWTLTNGIGYEYFKNKFVNVSVNDVISDYGNGVLGHFVDTLGVLSATNFKQSKVSLSSNLTYTNSHKILFGCALDFSIAQKRGYLYDEYHCYLHQKNKHHGYTLIEQTIQRFDFDRKSYDIDIAVSAYGVKELLEKIDIFGLLLIGYQFQRKYSQRKIDTIPKFYFNKIYWGRLYTKCIKFSGLNDAVHQLSIDIYAGEPFWDRKFVQDNLRKIRVTRLLQVQSINIRFLLEKYNHRIDNINLFKSYNWSETENSRVIYTYYIFLNGGINFNITKWLLLKASGNGVIKNLSYENSHFMGILGCHYLGQVKNAYLSFGISYPVVKIPKEYKVYNFGLEGKIDWSF